MNEDLSIVSVSERFRAAIEEEVGQPVDLFLRVDRSGVSVEASLRDYIARSWIAREHAAGNPHFPSDLLLKVIVLELKSHLSKQENAT